MFEYIGRLQRDRYFGHFLGAGAAPEMKWALLEPLTHYEILLTRHETAIRLPKMESRLKGVCLSGFLEEFRSKSYKNVNIDSLQSIYFD